MSSLLENLEAYKNRNINFHSDSGVTIKHFFERGLIPKAPPNENTFDLKSIIIEIRGFREAHLVHEFEIDNYLLVNSSFKSVVSGAKKGTDISDTSLAKKKLYPIYFITVGEGEKQEIVYIGQTLSGKRFNNGHIATQKLNEPIYDGKLKRVHFGQLWVNYSNEDEELLCPIEWVDNEVLVTDIVLFLERALMIHFKKNGEKLFNKAGVTNNPVMNLKWGDSGIPLTSKEREFQSICILDMCGSGFNKDLYEIEDEDILDILTEWEQHLSKMKATEIK